MNAKLALALLAVGPLKAGVPATVPVPPASKPSAQAATERNDPIAFLAREWLAKR